jgi:hypothetical protein
MQVPLGAQHPEQVVAQVDWPAWQVPLTQVSWPEHATQTPP